MTELIKITTEGDNQAVNARDLHAFLEVKTNFTDWIKRQIKYYDFVEGEDYVSLLKNEIREIGATTKTDYAISLDMAKELSMVARTPKGKQARQYFIQVEKMYREGYKQGLQQGLRLQKVKRGYRLGYGDIIEAIKQNFELPSGENNVKHLSTTEIQAILKSRGRHYDLRELGSSLKHLGLYRYKKSERNIKKWGYDIVVKNDVQWLK